MSLSLALLHARITDLRFTTALLDDWFYGQSHVTAAQILLYRFINASNATDRLALVEGLVQLYSGNPVEQKEIRNRLVAKEGLLGVFEKEKEDRESIKRMSLTLRCSFAFSSTDELFACSRVNSHYDNL